MISSFLNIFSAFSASFLNLRNVLPSLNIKEGIEESIIPNIFTGLKLGATLSVIGAIVAEFTGAEFGLGKNLFLTSIRIEPELMMLSIISSMILGCFLFATIYTIERFLGRWYIVK